MEALKDLTDQPNADDNTSRDYTEQFLLEVQKLRWKKLIRETPVRFVGLLADVKSCYDLKDADADTLAVRADMESLDSRTDLIKGHENKFRTTQILKEFN